MKGSWQRPWWRPGGEKWLSEEREGKEQAEGPRPEREACSRNREWQGAWGGRLGDGSGRRVGEGRGLGGADTGE